MDISISLTFWQIIIGIISIVIIIIGLFLGGWFIKESQGMFAPIGILIGLLIIVVSVLIGLVLGGIFFW